MTTFWGTEPEDAHGRGGERWSTQRRRNRDKGTVDTYDWRTKGNTEDPYYNKGLQGAPYSAAEGSTTRGLQQRMETSTTTQLERLPLRTCGTMLVPGILMVAWDRLL